MSAFPGSFNADSLLIPSGTERIEEEAFAFCASLDSVCVPEGVTQIGNRAFSGCVTLKEAQLPQSLEEIGEEAFSDCSECLLITCSPDSKAAFWAAASQLDWDADTVCRGLAIGQTYTGTDYALIGPTYDMHAIAFCLRKMGRTDYAVTEKTNQTAEGIRNAVTAAFADAGENDISLFYYSGHGERDGSLLGSDMNVLTPAELRSCLDGIAGRKVVIVDACHSGNLIQDGGAEDAAGESSMAAENDGTDDEQRTGQGGSPDINSQENENGNGSASSSDSTGMDADAVTGTDSASFTESFLEAFSGGGGSGKYLRSRGTLQSDSYFVMVSCQADEDAMEGYIKSGGSGRNMGYFTYALCEGCGWNGVTNRECELFADVNADGVVTFAEAFGYAGDWAASRNNNQHAAVYPEGCTWFSPFRK